ncbi:4-nitrophenylphosphatase [Protomyces lactucae-debilis]|uniref:4-nitrophenylphosphatase n=1 Tax=Protomyces lactucae-debilis TaxID=2754530 RepID=A0A1Y2FG90_PROLT|nr:4-nitrophenylphosphatase [Protomyces lactucae-debilis]ORY82434.1 4-nitrophenylphosphatase [Protomyces lactucae-debilis]
MAPIKLETRKLVDEFLDQYDYFLFDCDGVLWSGTQLLPYVCETLDMLRRLGKRIVFVTNNSTKSRTTYKKKLESMGIPAEIDEIFGSAYASAVYIKRVLKLPEDKKVYVIGESGIEEELAAEGVQYCGGTDPDERREMRPEDYDAMRPDPSVGAVLCGLDSHINYLKMCRAFQYLRDPDCLLLMTNTDSTYPTSGSLFPGAGSCSAPLRFATGREGKALGKPNPEMLDAIEAKFQFDKKKAVFIGDRLNTDIQFAHNSGMGGSLMVLTGVSSEADFSAKDAPVVPKYFIDRLGDLYTARQ